jgi:hypothetical protein
MAVARELKQKVLEQAGFCCHYCSNEANTVDHVVPIAYGGSNARSNLVAACEPCNFKRATFDYEIWRRFIRRFGQMPDDWKRQDTNLYRVNAVERIVENAGIEKAIEVLHGRFGCSPDVTHTVMRRFANRVGIMDSKLDRIFSDLISDYRHSTVDVSNGPVTMDSLSR